MGSSDDLNAGLKVASQADVTIIVGGTTSGESIDRPNLTLDHGIDDIIMKVAETNFAASKKTVVITLIPGAIVMPWRDSTSAILSLFLGGQETGSALASVL